MKYVYFTAALAALTFFCTPSVAQDCGLKEFASLELSPASSNRAVIDASLAGRPLHFLIDTGGYYSLLDKDVADALGLQSRSTNGLKLVGAAGGVIDHYVNATDFKAGPIAIPSMDMMVRDRPANEDSWDGSLAPDFLDHFEVDFDFAARKMNLFSPDHCEGQVVYWSKTYVDIPFRTSDAHIVFTMNLDGQDLRATLDTGSSISTISARLLRLFGLSEDSPAMEPIPGSKPGDLIQHRYRFKTLSLNGVAVNNPLLYILPDKQDDAIRNLQDSEKMSNDPIYGTQNQAPPIILGMNVLAKLHLFISYKEKKIYVTAADAH